MSEGGEVVLVLGVVGAALAEPSPVKVIWMPCVYTSLAHCEIAGSAQVGAVPLDRHVAGGAGRHHGQRSRRSAPSRPGRRVGEAYGGRMSGSLRDGSPAFPAPPAASPRPAGSRGDAAALTAGQFARGLAAEHACDGEQDQHEDDQAPPPPPNARLLVLESTGRWTYT